LQCGKLFSKESSSITTAAVAASTITTRLLLPTHLDATFTPATATHPLNTTLILIVSHFNDARLITILSHLAAIIFIVTQDAVDASTSPLIFFHADDAASNEGHENTTINTMVLFKVPHHRGPFIHYLTIPGHYFTSLLLSYISAPTQHGPLYPATNLTFLIQFSYPPSPSQINYIVCRCHPPQLGIT
jgi:hypothetical protein